MSLGRLAAVCACLALVAAGVPLGLWSFLPSGRFLVMAMLCTLPIALMGVRLHSLLQITLVLLLFGYVVAPLASELPLPMPAANAALTFAIAFTAALQLGYFLPPGATSVAKARPPASNVWSARGHRRVIVALALLAAAGFIAFLLMLGADVSAFFASSHRLRMYITSQPGMYFFRNLIIWAMWAAVFILMIPSLLGGTLTAGRRIGLTVTFAFMLVLTAGFGQRFYLFAPVLSLLMVLSLLGRRGATRIGIVALPLVILASAAYSFYRDLSYFGVAKFSELSETVGRFGIGRLVTLGAAVSGEKLRQLMLVVEHWTYEAEPLFLGKSFISVLWLPLPSSIIGDVKPIYT
jgi:hypothetical protein